MKSKKVYVVCKDTNTKGILAYYVVSNEGTYLLFTQKFRHSTYRHFRGGLPLKKALQYPARNDSALCNTIRRLLPSIQYIEKTYDVQLLDKTRKVA